MYFPTFSSIYSCVPRTTLRIRTQTVLPSGNRSRTISTLFFLIQTVGRVRNSRKWGRQPSLLAWSRILALGIRDWHLLQKVKQVYTFPFKMDCLLAPWRWVRSACSCCRGVSHDGKFKDGDGVVIVDAGGGTIDISSYCRNKNATKENFEEIAAPQCKSYLFSAMRKDWSGSRSLPWLGVCQHPRKNVSW